MRQVTQDIVNAFIARKARTISNSHTDGETLYLHGNKIAWHGSDGYVYATLCGWGSTTTRERLNGLCDSIGIRSRFYQRDFVQCFGPGVDAAREEIDDRKVVQLTDDRKAVR